jgi:hypothetical protein
MKFLKDIRVYVVITCLSLIYAVNQNIVNKTKITNLENELSKVESEKDSLKDELFINKVEVGRYELTIDHLKEYDPKAYKEFDRYLSHETE